MALRTFGNSDHLPLVRGFSGHTTKFDPEWFRAALSIAASHAGYQGWWLVDDLTTSVAHHLRADHANNIIDIHRLERTIRFMLWSVGHQDIAVHFQTSLPYHTISLLACLQTMAISGHTGFFEHLAEQIAVLHRFQTRHIHFSNLAACVDELQSRWPVTRTAGSRTLLGDVVDFIRERVQSQWSSQGIRCSIS